MPTDAELRSLFRESATPAATIDTSAIIRRSRRRRLPQQLGVGSVLTLAVAGIGVASFTGIQGLTPSMMAADAPAGVAESGTFSGPDMATTRDCAVAATGEDPVSDTVEVVVDFPASAQAGEPVHGTLAVTNTGQTAVSGTVGDASVSLAGGDETTNWHDSSAVGTPIVVPPGGTTSIPFTFEISGCDADGSPLQPGSYDISATLIVDAADGTRWRWGGPASAITIR